MKNRCCAANIDSEFKYNKFLFFDDLLSLKEFDSINIQSR